MATEVAGPGGAVESKGLKTGALGLASATVIGVASTAPAYSLAATLGLRDVLRRASRLPAIMWIAFLPMGCIAAAFYYLNRADPDCGTNFSWVTRAMGPRTGWLGGWSSMMADLIVMPSLAFIAAQYTFLLFGWDNLGQQHARAPGPRHRLHHGHDVDLRRRHRAQRPHADGPAADRARRARPVQRGRARSRRSATRKGFVHPSLVVVDADGLRGRQQRSAARC